jgi:hypothetical protein
VENKPKFNPNPKNKKTPLSFSRGGVSIQIIHVYPSLRFKEALFSSNHG